jgi:hypothetical protein
VGARQPSVIVRKYSGVAAGNAGAVQVRALAWRPDQSWDNARDAVKVRCKRRVVGMTARDEARIRRAIRYVIQSSRENEGNDDLTGIFNLLPYLKPEAEAVVADETARTLAELFGCT